jgi:hypothetical protein
MEFGPYLGIKLSALPALQYSLQATLASTVRLNTRLVRVEEGAAKGSNGVNGAAIAVGQEPTGSVRLSSRHQRWDAKRVTATHDEGPRRSQKVLFRPDKQVFIGCEVLVDSIQVRRDQVARDVPAASRTFTAIALRAIEAELTAKGIDHGQSVFTHERVRMG